MIGRKPADFADHVTISKKDRSAVDRNAKKIVWGVGRHARCVHIGACLS